MMEMPVVSRCEAESCAYNRDRTCHALAITIGNARHAVCDTFYEATFKGGDASSVGHVGACKMSECRHNVDLECQAPRIDVGFHEEAIDCLTFQPV